MAFQKGHTGFARKSFAVGGKERVRVSAYRIVMSDGTELELEGHFTSEGHARLHALEYMERTKRSGRTIASVRHIVLSANNKTQCDTVKRGDILAIT